MDLMDRRRSRPPPTACYDEWGHLDVLVNNAVHTGPGSMIARFEDTTLEMIETKLQANVLSQVVMIKAVLPRMVEAGGGRIVNVTSAVAITDPPAPAGEGGWGSAYRCRRARSTGSPGSSLVGYMPLGIEIFNVEPGFVVTERMEVNA